MIHAILRVVVQLEIESYVAHSIRLSTTTY